LTDFDSIIITISNRDNMRPLIYNAIDYTALTLNSKPKPNSVDRLHQV